MELCGTASPRFLVCTQHTAVESFLVANSRDCGRATFRNIASPRLVMHLSNEAGELCCFVAPTQVDLHFDLLRDGLSGRCAGQSRHCTACSCGLTFHAQFKFLTSYRVTFRIGSSPSHRNTATQCFAISQDTHTHTHTRGWPQYVSMCADPTSGVLSPDSEKYSGCLER